MARSKGPKIEVSITEAGIVVRAGERTVTFPAIHEEDSDVVVLDTDAAASFDPPHENEEIPIELLQRMMDAIEAYCDTEEIDVEFE